MLALTKTYSMRELAEMTGVAIATIGMWVSRKMIPAPAQASRFTDRQAVGMLVGTALYHSERGCSPHFVGVIMRRFEEMTDDEFEGWLDMKSPIFRDQIAGGVSFIANQPQEIEAINSRLATAQALIKARRAIPEFIVTAAKKKKKGKKERRNGLNRRRRDRISPAR